MLRCRRCLLSWLLRCWTQSLVACWRTWPWRGEKRRVLSFNWLFKENNIFISSSPHTKTQKNHHPIFNSVKFIYAAQIQTNFHKQVNNKKCFLSKVIKLRWNDLSLSRIEHLAKHVKTPSPWFCLRCSNCWGVTERNNDKKNVRCFCVCAVCCTAIINCDMSVSVIWSSDVMDYFICEGLHRDPALWLNLAYSTPSRNFNNLKTPTLICSSNIFICSVSHISSHNIPESLKFSLHSCSCDVVSEDCCSLPWGLKEELLYAVCLLTTRRMAAGGECRRQKQGTTNVQMWVQTCDKQQKQWCEKEWSLIGM